MKIESLALMLISAPFIDVYSDFEMTELSTQLLCGEQVYVMKTENGISEIRSLKDDYRGYVKYANLVVSDNKNMSGYKVLVPKTFLFSAPNIKSPHPKAHYFGAILKAEDYDDQFMKVGTGFVSKVHLSKKSIQKEEILDYAQKFIGVPYLWGGKTFEGIDCSGLIQILLHAADINCPRDAKPQEKALGTLVESRENIQPGDIVFFNERHVGIMVDKKNILHANQTKMAVTIDDLDFVAEIAKGISSIKRL